MSVFIPENETAAPKTVAELIANIPEGPRFGDGYQNLTDYNQYRADLAYAASREGWTDVLDYRSMDPTKPLPQFSYGYNTGGAAPVATKPVAERPGNILVLYADGSILEQNDYTPVKAGGAGGGVGGAFGGAGGGFTGPGGTNAMGFTSAQMGAREFLLATMRQYFSSPQDKQFLDSITKDIDNYIRQGYDSNTISVLLPQTEAYKQRFKGNEGRIAAGMAALNPAEYLQAESTYNEILSRYNLGDLATRDIYNSLIGGLVSAAELTDRVVNVYDRIRNADTALRDEMNRIESLSRGQLTDADFAKALLTGKTGAEQLKRKISIAEISAEARTRGLSVTSAEELQKLGVTREQAKAGFETISEAQPTFEKLAGIFDKEALAPATSQAELEREVFQGMQSQRRKRLVQQEQATFSGASGLTGSALSRQRAGQL